MLVCHLTYLLWTFPMYIVNFLIWNCWVLLTSWFFDKIFGFENSTKRINEVSKTLTSKFPIIVKWSYFFYLSLNNVFMNLHERFVLILSEANDFFFFTFQIHFNDYSYHISLANLIFVIFSLNIPKSFNCLHFCQTNIRNCQIFYLLSQ